VEGQLKTRWGSLALVPNPASPAPQTSPDISFCTHCGSRPAIDQPPSRVCTSCGLGLVLSASGEAAPAEGDAFLVLDSSLAVCAVSEAAERLLGTPETGAVNRHITQLLVPADAEAQGPTNLAVAVTWAARGDDAMHKVVVRPANTFGVRLTARIASCGPPTAALVVFE
jgi:hypothetical protein